MITDGRFVAYINSLDAGNPAYLDELEAYAIDTQVPIIRKEMQSFMRTMIVMNKPKRILEVGTAIGFSALLMSEFMPKDGHITTIENYDKRIPIARDNFHKYGKDDQITLVEGDAAEVLKTLDGPYDFIFMDAAKGQYIHYFPDIMRILAPGGVLISDNVMQDGDIIESKYAVTRRDRTIHKRMREYLFTLKHHDELETAILTLGDGVAVSVRKT